MSKCEDCGLELGFRKNGNGRTEPCNPDGSDHWDLCSQTRLQNIKRDGVFVTRKSVTGIGRMRRTVVEEGYEYRGKFIKTGWRYARHGEE